VVDNVPVEIVEFNVGGELGDLIDEFLSKFGKLWLEVVN